MLFSPEMDATKAPMSAILLRDPEGFFDGPKEGEDLQIYSQDRLRIVFVFLQQSKDVPELGEAGYMTATIRSGLDSFFSMAQTAAF